MWGTIQGGITRLASVAPAKRGAVPSGPSWARRVAISAWICSGETAVLGRWVAMKVSFPWSKGSTCAREGGEASAAGITNFLSGAWPPLCNLPRSSAPEDNRNGGEDDARPGKESVHEREAGRSD